jgi:ubiquinone biosynthesis protein COQ9
MTDPRPDDAEQAAIRDRLLDAALPHVAFDGWSPATVDAAIADSGLDPALARAAIPRGAVDLARAFHRRGDAAMAARLAGEDLSALRFRDRIAAAVRFRLEAVAGEKEAVRRGAALFALPPYAADGAALVWGTCDRIWTALGDSSDDINWYTKRATLAAVYGATVLYWLGDTSEGHAATWAFLDRRIGDVMKIETAKARLRDAPLVQRFMDGPGRALSAVKAPRRGPRTDLPGYLAPRR